MISWIGASFLVAGFLGLLRLFRLVERGRESIDVVQRSLAKLTDRTLDDDAKEKAMREYSLRLFALFGLLAVFGAAAVFIPYGVLWLGARLGWLDLRAILDTAFSWPFLCASALVATAVLWAWAGTGRAASSGDGFKINYSATDRLLHQIAFATTSMQTAIAGLEDRMFRRRIASVRMGPPVFICGLPRAGSTLLLDLLARTSGVVTHTYRDMPFLHVPLLWHGFARAFRASDTPRERAHGDGMMVSVDSPEALEEALWIGYWKNHYRKDRIRPWRADERNAAFLRFFERHMRKLACARGRPGESREVRYVSKNNLNIARVGWLCAAFPDARVIVPFREPLQHAASLRRQHLNFLEIHRRDDFARQYMAAIGHFDFGANLRPVDFDGWRGGSAPETAIGLNFWLRYWISGYACLLREESPRARFLGYDAFCAAPGAGLSRLADFLELEEREVFCSARETIHSPRPHPIAMEEVDPALLDAARAVHDRLMERAENRRQSSGDGVSVEWR